MLVCKSSSFIVHLVIFMRIQQKINLYSCFILMKKKNYLSLDLVPKLLICLSPFFCTRTIIQRYPNLPQYWYLLEHNFTLGLLPIYIVHINENNQRLVNSYDPNILYDEKGTQRYHEGNKIYFLLLHCKSLSSSEIKL